MLTKIQTLNKETLTSNEQHEDLYTFLNFHTWPMTPLSHLP